MVWFTDCCIYSSPHSHCLPLFGRLPSEFAREQCEHNPDIESKSPFRLSKALQLHELALVLGFLGCQNAETCWKLSHCQSPEINSRKGTLTKIIGREASPSEPSPPKLLQASKVESSETKGYQKNVKREINRWSIKFRTGHKSLKWTWIFSGDRAALFKSLDETNYFVSYEKFTIERNSSGTVIQVTTWTVLCYVWQDNPLNKALARVFPASILYFLYIWQVFHWDFSNTSLRCGCYWQAITLQLPIKDRREKITRKMTK